jgi:uncharacterized protein YfaS (alpha-2-macroglobulin family)
MEVIMTKHHIERENVRKCFLLSTILIIFLLSSCNLPGKKVDQVSQAAPETEQPPEPKVLADVPPSLLESTPLPGSEIGLSEMILLTFTQPMDQASVEAAFQGEPAISGRFEWQDEKTVAFTPDQIYPLDTQMEITVGESAMASNGKNLLKPIKIQFHVSKALKVTNIIPAVDSEEVDPASQIVVAFNQPVVNLGQEDPPNAISLQPEIVGKGEWINTSTFIFHPEPGLVGGTIYTVNLNGNLTSSGGAPIDPESLISWKFSTAKPQVIETTPLEDPLSLDGPIVVDFNIRMDTSLTEEAFSLKDAAGVKVSGDFSWNDTQTQLSFKPHDLLDRLANYTLTISTDAASYGGMPLEDSYAKSFLTYPDFSTFINRNADFKLYYANYGYFEIQTTTPVDKSSLKNSIQISPEISEMNVYPTYEKQGLTVSGYFKPGTDYKVTLSHDLKDIWGASPDEPMSFTFSTNNVTPDFTISATSSGYGQNLLFSPSDESNLFGQATNITYARTSIAKIDFEDFTWYFKLENSDAIQNYSPDNQQVDTINFDLPLNQSEVVSIPLKYDDQNLTPGLYYLKVMAPEVVSRLKSSTTGFILAVSNYNTVFKISNEQIFVWVSSISDRSPLINASVQVISTNGTVVTTGKTNSSGIFEADIPHQENLYETYFAVIGDVDEPDTFSLASSSWGSNFLQWDLGLNVNTSPSPYLVYTYTDRPIYRPGQEVNFKSIIRGRTNSIYSLVDFQDLTVEAHGSSGDGTDIILYSSVHTLSNFGSLSGQFTLPETSTPGYYYLTIKKGDETLDSYYFEVANYRKPEIELKVSLAPDAILYGEGLQATIQADYYFGVPSANLDVTWNLYAHNLFFDLHGYSVGDLDTRWMQPAYTFYDYSTYGELVASGSGQTDQNGSMAFSITPEQINLDQTSGFTELTLEASITDQSGFMVSERTQSLMHPEAYYIGVHPNQYFSRENDEVAFEILTVGWDAQPSASKQLEAIFSKITWEIDGYEGIYMTPNYVINEEGISSASPTTSQEGESRVAFTPTEPGTYQLTVRGGKAETRVLIWVGGASAAAWPQLPNNKLELTPDASLYAPGDTATIFIPNPFPNGAKALITLERGKVMFSDVVEVTGSGISYPLNLGESEIPNVYFGVIIFGKDAAGQPDYRQGMVNLNVSPSSRILDIKLTMEPALTAPGDDLKAYLEIKASDGNPIQGEFSLAMIDKSILALKDPIELPIQDAFFGNQPISVLTSSSISAFATQQSLAPSPVGGMGGGSGEPPALREDFPDTAFWQGQIVTDVDGKAVIIISLPDNLTTWHVLVRGITDDTLVGEAVAEVVTQKELMILPETPRFLVAGDHVNLMAIVHNNTDEDLSVEVSLQDFGLRLDESNLETQVISLPAHSNSPVTWWGVVESVEAVDLVFSAKSGDLQDASRPSWGSLPVLRYLTPMRYTTSGVLSEAGTTLEVVSIPGSFQPEGGELELALSPSLASSILDSLKVVNADPYTDNVTLMAIALANHETYQMIKTLGIDTPDLLTDLETQIQNNIYQINAKQNYDGGWCWSGSNDLERASDPFFTAYILHGLEVLSEAGYNVSYFPLQNAREFVNGKIQMPESKTDTNALDELVFMIYAHHTNSSKVPDLLDDLYSLRSQLSPHATAQLALSLVDLDQTDPRIKTLLSDLEGSAIRSATGAHWESGTFSWKYPGTAAYSTSFALMAIAELDPASDLLVDGTRYLINIRQGEHLWGSIYDNSWVLAALNRALSGTGDLQADFTFKAALNDLPVAEGNASGPDTLVPVSVSVPLSDLMPDSPNALTITRGEGAGRLYYRTDLLLHRLADSAPAINKGMVLERQYFLGDDCTEGCLPVNEVVFESGKIPPMVTVQLTLIVPNDMYHIRLEDYIPAGSEIFNPNLQTSQSSEEGFEVTLNNTEYGYWVWLFFDEPQVYDDHILWTADYLPAGTYTLSYKFNPFQAGEFQVLPAHAYQFFFPEVEGTSSGDLFKIIKQ